MTILDGVLNASGDNVTVNGTSWDTQTSTTGLPGAEFIQTGSGSVTFTNTGPITIKGANTFYNFSYNIANGQIIFEALNGLAVANADLVTQTIAAGGSFNLNGQAAGTLIVLESDNPGAHGASNQNPADPLSNQWVINIETGASSSIEFTDIRSSCAYNTPAGNSPPHAIFPKSTSIDGGDNTIWIFAIPIESSWTEDIDGDGRIDRIRVRVSDLVDLTGGDGTGVSAYVEGYTVTGVTRANASEDYEFFINIAENKELDTDATPFWRLTDNPGAVPTGLFGVGGAKVVDSDLYTPPAVVDRAAPAIGYTLAVAGKDEIFVHMSEYAQRDTDSDGHGDGPLTAADFTYNGGASVSGLTRITTSGDGTSEFIIKLDDPVTADEIYNQTTITLNTDLADNVDVTWPASDGNPLAAEDTRLPAGSPIIRVSDLGLGALGTDETGIFQPVWATTDSTNRSDLGGTGKIDRVEYGDFDSSGWLQDEDFTLQISLDSSFSNAATETVELIWDTSVASPYLLNGMWLPNYDPPDNLAAPYGYTPYPNNPAPAFFFRDFLFDFVNYPNTASRVSNAVSSSGSTRTYHFDSTDSKIVNGKEFQFSFGIAMG